MNGRRGFTLVELAAVITIIGLLYAVGTPIYRSSIQRAKESALLEDLKVMRKAIDVFYADQLRYPERLDELVDKRYLRKIPEDPFTGVADWNTLTSDAEASDVYDVKSRYSGISEDGMAYSEW
ncbi:MAG: prepilin-type N-terminal cleavage/methylation domain-containing protein [Candidatus Wallbacteria bacterium]|nr:prepilin-type N-terminal cleavage/methylation domain-containing protein [Candidatus Wallbacteria bacterium]